MPTTLYLTVDLHAHRWFDAEADDAAIWLCLQPHIRRAAPGDVDVEYAALRKFVEDANRGENFEYVLLSEDEASRSDFVPVNFPSDVDLTIQWDADGPLRQPNPNSRSSGMVVVDQTVFNNDNRGRRADDTAGRDETEAKIEAVPVGPFAASYNTSLQGAMAAMDNDQDADLSDLANQLVLGFWGGVRRRLREGSVIPGDIEFMALDTGDPEDEAEQEADPTFRVTNLHSLNGLMFKVLDRRNVPDLGDVRDLEIQLNHRGGSVPPLKFSEQAAQGLVRLQEFFKSLSAVPGDVLDDLIEEEAPGFRSRVYIDDQLVGFGAVQLETGAGGAIETWFRRRTERRADSSLESQLRDLSRLVVNFGRSERSSDDSNLPPVEGDIVLEVADVLECRFIRYRLGGATEPGSWIVARLTPTEGDKDQFERELKDSPNCFDGKPIIDADGKALDATEVRYLGCYKFLWEGEDDVPLFLVKSEAPGTVDDDASGVLGSRETVSVVLLREQPTGTPIRLTLKPAGARTKEESMIDATGPRWELSSNPQLPATEFEMFRLVSPRLSMEDQARMVIAAGFRDDVEFVFANSASRYEGIVKVTYPALAGQEAERELREDLVNFNTLNVYHRWPALSQALSGESPDEENVSPELNTRYSELFPFWSKDDNAHAVSVAFQYLFKQPVQSPPGDLVETEIARYFDALYDAAGTHRYIDFRLEHTYGSEIDLGTDRALPCKLDVRPLLPPHVASARFNPEPELIVDAPPFFSIGFQKDGETEKLVLTFERRYLNPSLAPRRQPDEDRLITARREAHANAYRALCELAYAEKIELEGRFLSFSFREALQSDSGSFVAGLTPVDAFSEDDSGWPLHLNASRLPPTENLQVLARGLIDAWTAPAQLEITLPVGNHPQVSKSCNVIEFSLKVTRKGEKVPANDPSLWSVVRAVVRPTRLDWTGPQLQPAVGVDETFARFLDGLHIGRAKIQPDETTHPNSEKLLGLLSEDDVDSARAWIVPQGLARIDDKEITASLTPLSFVPVQPHLQLGPQTFELGKRYLKGLQTLLALTPGAWTPTGTDEQVLAAWRALLSRIAAQRENLEELAKQLREFLRPVHLAAGDPDDELDGEVRQAIRDLTDPQTEPARQVQRAVREASLRLLRTDVSIFGDAKAVLYSRLRDKVTNSKVTPTFHAWKTIRESAGGKLRDQRRLTYPEGLTDVANQEGFGFLEVLLDAGYSNEFQQIEEEAQSFESLIEPFERDKNGERDAKIPLDGGRVKLPYKDAHSEGHKVFLPSRQPIREPALASAEIFEGIQQDDLWSDVIRNVANEFDLNDFLKGRLTPTQTGSRVTLRAASDEASRNKERDDFLATAVFQVWSNEEDDFSTDAFDVWIEDAPEEEVSDLRTESASLRFSEKFLGQLFKLADSPQIAGIADLHELLDHVDEARDLFHPVSDPGKHAWQQEPSLRLVVETKNGQEILRRIDNSYDPSSYLEAFLLRLPDEQGAAARPRAHYLFLAAERRIWRRTAIRLGQSRNRKEIIGPDFAPVFGFTSRSRTSAVPQQFAPAYEESRVVTLPSRTLKWSEIEEELVKLQILSSSELRRQNLLVVSVYHEQRGEVRQGYFDQSGAEQDQNASAFLSKFALQIVNVAPEDSRTIEIEFAEPYDHFMMDLQWFSDRNRELFRLSSIPVRILHVLTQ